MPPYRDPPNQKPEAPQDTAYDALVKVCNEIDQNGSGTADDYAFMRAILQDVVVDAMFQTHDKLNRPMEPADHNANATVNHLLDILDQSPAMNDADTRELFDILADADMQAVLMAHDDIARKSFEPVQYPLEPEPQDDNNMVEEGPIRIIGVRRQQGEPLGITVGNDENRGDELIIIRIAPGSTTDKQGLLHVGDVIAEVNGVPVHSPDELGDVISNSGPDIKFKVIPALAGGTKDIGYRRFLKTHFAYNPFKDSRISAPALGLEFDNSDILAVINDNDKNWWECKNLGTGKTGKIPSAAFEERRRQISQAPPDKQKSSFLCGLGKKKKKYNVNPPTKQDDIPAVLYEDVIKVKSYRHMCVVLVGAQGIGRRSIKHRLIQMMPHDYGAPIPNTSRSMREGEEDGCNYRFLSKAEMEADIRAGRYLEYGELKGNYYGTSFSALKLVMDQNKACIVDPKSAVLTKLRTSEWKPYVIFVKPPDVDTLRQMNLRAIDDGIDTARKSEDELRRIMEETQRIAKQFIHLCDATVTYDSFDSTCRKILDLLKRADSTPQWVPSTWESTTEKIAVTD